MKKVLFGIISILVITISFQSCKEDIELIGEFEETAVVYGILDQADSIHMIKITRAFITESGENAFDVAQDPNRSYFDNVEATVTEYNGGVPTGRVFTLTDTLVDNKDPNGVFYAPQQKLYYFKTSPSSPLIGGYTYKFNADINDGLFNVEGETTLVNGMATNVSGNYTYQFIDNFGEYRTSAVIVSNMGTAHAVNVKLTMKYSEWIGTDSTINTFDWSLGELIGEPNSSVTFSAAGKTFYDKMAADCSTNPSIDKRTFNSVTTVITGAHEDLVEYMQINEPSSTLAQSKPTYTNLTATNDHPVIGIFSSRFTMRIEKPFYIPSQPWIRILSAKTTEKLCIGPITGPYLFCSDHPGDFAESWACP